jgi:type I restriction enzyme S subunit
MIENIPAGWRVEKLQDITEFLTCGVAKRPQYINKVTGIPFLSSKNVKTNKMLLGDYSLISKEDYKILTKYYKPKKGDILYTRVGSFGEATVVDVDFDFAIFVSLTIIRVKNEVINNRYLSNILNSRYIKQLANEKARGIAVKNLNVGDVRKFLIPIPPIKQQQKIVKVLDITTNLINQQQELLKQYDLFLKSKFIEMFGCPAKNTMEWNVKTIEEVVKDEKYSLKRGPFGGSLKKEIFVRDGYLVYEQFHALNNDFSMERYFIDEEKFNELKAFSVKGGDIIISCSGVYLGKLAIIPLNYKKGIINQALLKISLNEEKMNSVLFTYIFTNNNFKQRFFGNFIGSGIPNFPPMSDFKKFIFISPPINLQNRFADIVEKIENIKTQQNKKLLQLQDLHNSLMQKAFKGEIK